MRPSVFVSGGAAGIGKATAELFAERGHFVGIYDLDGAAADNLARELGQHRAVAGALDVRDPAAFASAVGNFAQAAGGALSVLVNNAGVLRMGAFADQSSADDRLQIDVNVLGVLNGVRAALPHMQAAAKGVIVNLSSASALYGTPDLAVYSATKFAVRGLTEALDIELGPRGIRVADVLPGFVDTDMVRSQATPSQSLKNMGAKLTARDVAEAVWTAAHKKRLHVFLDPTLQLMQRLGGAAPSLAKRVMQHYSRPR
jgi:NADP-dependent 3-hydroxy acid dehydrogenase YdfG